MFEGQYAQDTRAHYSSESVNKYVSRLSNLWPKTVMFIRSRLQCVHDTVPAGPSDRNYLQAPAEPCKNLRLIFYLMTFLLFVHEITITKTTVEFGGMLPPRTRLSTA